VEFDLVANPRRAIDVANPFVGLVKSDLDGHALHHSPGNRVVPARAGHVTPLLLLVVEHNHFELLVRLIGAIEICHAPSISSQIVGANGDRAAMRTMSSYAYVFPIGRPRNYLWRGHRDLKRGRGPGCLSEQLSHWNPAMVEVSLPNGIRGSPPGARFQPLTSSPAAYRRQPGCFPVFLTVGRARIASSMRSTARSKSQSGPRYYRGADIPLAEIRRFARQVAEQFQPEKIILFGSYAYGTPHADSDVDILVVMPTRNQLDQAEEILRV
jgi:hypothetical protein